MIDERCAYLAGTGPYALTLRSTGVPVDASAVKASFIRSTSPSDISSRLIREFRAISLTRINSSSLSCIACVSRVWVFWITNTIRKVTIVVAVLMTSCQVSDQPKIGPDAAHRTTTAIASRKVDERPTCRSTQRANRAKNGIASGSASEILLACWSKISTLNIFAPVKTRVGGIRFQCRINLSGSARAWRNRKSANRCCLSAGSPTEKGFRR